MEDVRIPEERISVLIGGNGRTKKLIEKTCGVAITIHEEDVVIESENKANEYFAKDVVKAIGRGFSPRDSIRIFTDDCHLFIFDLKEYAKSRNSIHRIKGRVIGENGKIKKIIETSTDSKLSIYGNTISVLAKLDSIEYAKKAVEKIILGAKHTSVLGYLSRAKKEIFHARLSG